MDEYLTRREKKEADEQKIKAFGDKMRLVLSNLSKQGDGQQLLRFILHESCFLNSLMYETPEGVNKDVMIANEAKRRIYLTLRSYMDRETIIRVELPDSAKPKGETNA